jgi:hypothetical protein
MRVALAGPELARIDRQCRLQMMAFQEIVAGPADCGSLDYGRCGDLRSG